MGATYDDVLALLLGWGDTKPPKQIVEKALKAGMSPDQIADGLTAYVWRMAHPPKGSTQDPFDYGLYYAFGGGAHFNLDHANIALGFSPEPDPLPSRPRAYTAEDAWESVMLGWYPSGTVRFLDLGTDEGREEFARRWKFGLTMPASWDGIDPKLYLFFALTNLIPSQPAPFGVRVSEQAETYRGFSFQMYLDNQNAVLDMMPAPWGPGGVRQ